MGSILSRCLGAGSALEASVPAVPEGAVVGAVERVVLGAVDWVVVLLVSSVVTLLEQPQAVSRETSSTKAVRNNPAFFIYISPFVLEFVAIMSESTGITQGKKCNSFG